MPKYSIPEQISVFCDQLGDRPFFVCDMDGNVMHGFSLVPGKSLASDCKDKNHDIPFGLAPENLDKLVMDGVLKKEIFATKSMDVRLLPELVQIVNKNIKERNKFSLGFLTSRSAIDALKLLEESGVKEPDQVTLVADSGATLYIDGHKTSVRTLTQDEKSFLNGIRTLESKLMQDIKMVLKECGFNPDQCPDFYIENKGIATNIHYRTILKHYEQEDGSNLDKKLGTVIKTRLQAEVDKGPRNAAGEITFATLDGPATVEVKVAKVNKGFGLEALARAALASDNSPTALVFSGDDVSKGNGTPGTDYAAMIRGSSLSKEIGLHVFNIHTHHPVGGDMSSLSPDPLKSPTTLNEAEYPLPQIHLTVPTPAALGSIILASLTAPLEKLLVSQLISEFSLWSKVTEQKAEQWLREHQEDSLALVLK